MFVPVEGRNRSSSPSTNWEEYLSALSQAGESEPVTPTIVSVRPNLIHLIEM